MQKKIAAVLPDCRYEEIPDCGHVAYLEAPDPFFARVREWAADIDRRTDGKPCSSLRPVRHSDPTLERLLCLQNELNSIYEGGGKFRWTLLSFSSQVGLNASKSESTLDPTLVEGNAHATTEIISHLFDYLSGWDLLAWNARNTSSPERQTQLSRLLARAAFIRFCSMLDAFARLVLAHSGVKLRNNHAPSFSQLLNLKNPTKFRKKLSETHKPFVDRLKTPVESVQSIRNALVHREVFLNVTQSSGSLTILLQGTQRPPMKTMIFSPSPEQDFLEFDLYQSWILSEFLVAVESFIGAESERLGLHISDRPRGGPLKVSHPVRDSLEVLIDRL